MRGAAFYWLVTLSQCFLATVIYIFITDYAPGCRTTFAEIFAVTLISEVSIGLALEAAGY